MSMRSRQEGHSLIETALGMIVLGLLIITGIYLYQLRVEHDKIRITETNTRTIQEAIQNFAAVHGRLPCPASSSAGLDTAEFGVEFANNCVGAAPGIMRDASASVVIGTVPVRSLNISDTDIADGWNHRFIYAVTEQFARSGADLKSGEGKISVVDTGGNSLSAQAGQAIYVLLSSGQDARGAYSFAGKQLQTCNTSVPSGENCDGDAEFVDTVYKSFNDTAMISSNMSFMANITSYEWQAGPYGSCSNTCGASGSVQTRTVICVDQNGNQVTDSRCTGPKPPLTKSCPSTACKWKTGGYGACTCGSTTVSRDVFCTGSSGETVPEAHCLLPKPESSKSCGNTDSLCSYSWKVGAYSACNKECNGVKTRTVYCLREETNEKVADSFCKTTKPATQADCPNSDKCDPVLPCPPGEYCGPKPPTQFCFFNVSGGLVGEKFIYGWSTEIGTTDHYSNLVGEGEYPYSSPPNWGRVMHDFSHAEETIDLKKYPLGRATAYTFDGLAIGKKTRIIIYEKPNFQGPVVVDLKGPLIVNNGIWEPMNYAHGTNEFNVKDFSKHPLLSQFPPSSRIYSNGYEKVLPMQYWGRQTSIKVICDD